MNGDEATSFDVLAAMIARQQERDGNVFPFVYRCQSPQGSAKQAADWVAERRDELLAQATDHGAVLFRDFPLRNAEDFDTFIAGLALENFPYEKSLSSAVRTSKTERVVTANESPPGEDILFHHEMAQTPHYPKWLMFFCEKPADRGGATPFCRSDWLYNRLIDECPDFVRDCTKKGLQYSYVMPVENDPNSSTGRSWRSTLGVVCKDDAEARLTELNYAFEWLGDDALRATTPQLPAVMEVAPGRHTFFNQLIAAYGGWKDSRNDPSCAIRHGDGSNLDSNAVLRAVALSEELSFDAEWIAGDVALIDNTIVMHGRRPFAGARNVLASLCEMKQQSFAPIACS
tara:strand:- start:169 stop:1200 length:1032 start_codon:yes stop_codon:yes gene_type:complete